MIRYPKAELIQRRDKEHWIRIVQFDGDLEELRRFVNLRFGTFAASQVNAILPEIEKAVGWASPKPGSFMIDLDQGKGRNFVSLSKLDDDFTLVWASWLSEEARREHAGDLDGVACLRKMAALALGDRSSLGIRFSEQEDRSFMWKAPSVHPLQVLENSFQRIVHKAAQEPDVDPIKAQSETLARYFIQDAGQPVSFQFNPHHEPVGPQLASVKMNHLIETFYLFRLLVQYQIESATPISDEHRVDLSGNLTKLLHNGDRATMGWLSAWLAEKIGELGTKIDALNSADQRRVLFFLKGGRALNYFLGTPEKGENDWDTQVVINPNLPAEDWYQCFADVHDVLLSTLQDFKAEFTLLVETNAPAFTEYLKGKAGAEMGEDEEVDENEASDINSRIEHANCKAELIDIGIPRRGSASGIEEWTRLGAAGALRVAGDGVIYPHREYYLNEYLMMIREAFIPLADARKAPKRITRFGLILSSETHEEPSPVETMRLLALPMSSAVISGLEHKGRRDLFRIMVSQFVEAYNLLQDRELAALFDAEFVAHMENPPKLPLALADVLDEVQRGIARDVGIAHALSELMQEHWDRRSQFFDQQDQFFNSFLRDLSQLTNVKLQKVGAQFAIAGSYAARLHAEHLRVKPVGLEPIRRILVKLQCPKGHSEAEVLHEVREDIVKAAAATGKLSVADISDDKGRSLVLNWNEKVAMGKYSYSPIVMKIRGAAQMRRQLPVLASIDGLPVLDLRYLVADYLKKNSKIDEQGSRRTLASATAAISEMLSRFDIESDDD